MINIIAEHNGTYKELTFKPFKFPGGELHFNIPEKIEPGTKLLINASLHTSDDIMLLVLIAECFRHLDKTLDLAYTPYARQDRRTSHGEPFSFRAFAKLINSLGFKKVIVYDTHSHVIDALIDNIYVVTQQKIVADELPHWFTKNTVLVAPDAGALKKTGEIAKHFGVPFVVGMKVRDTMTGEITGTRIDNGLDLTDKDIVICDDICDGGRTFIELAKAIRREYKPRSMKLFTTVGIYSKGIEVLEAEFDSVKCYHAF